MRGYPVQPPWPDAGGGKGSLAPPPLRLTAVHLEVAGRLDDVDPAVTQAVPHVRRVLGDFPAGGEEVAPGPAVAQRHRVLVDETPGLDTIRAAVQVGGARSRAAALAGSPGPGLLLRPA